MAILDTEFEKEWFSYGRPERTDIADSDLNSLLRAEIILQVLMEQGVHNWDGFDEAMKVAKEKLK